VKDADRELLAGVGAKLDELRRALRAHAASYHQIRKLQQSLNDDYFDLVVRVTGEDPAELEHRSGATPGAFKEGNEYGRIKKEESDEEKVSTPHPRSSKPRDPGGKYVRHGMSCVSQTGDSNPITER
jgi:hypothetical protein